VFFFFLENSVDIKVIFINIISNRLLVAKLKTRSSQNLGASCIDNSSSSLSQITFKVGLNDIIYCNAPIFELANIEVITLQLYKYNFTAEYIYNFFPFFMAYK
jgi:hypothetical protein